MASDWRREEDVFTMTAMPWGHLTEDDITIGDPMLRWLLQRARINLHVMSREQHFTRLFLEWLVEMDDVDPKSRGYQERRRVTLGEVIQRAREVIERPTQDQLADLQPEIEEIAALQHEGSILRVLEAWEAKGSYVQLPWNEITAVLWWFDYSGGSQPGPFYSHLMRALSSATMQEKDALQGVFPDLVIAFRIAQNVPAGPERLCALIEPQRGARQIEP